MSGKVNPVSGEVLGLFRNSSISPFGSTWVSLLTTLPTNDGQADIYPESEVEWSLTSNRRQRVYNDGETQPYWTLPAVDPSDPNRMKIDNSSTISWPEITLTFPSTEETVKGVAIYSAQSGGNLLYWDVLDADRLVMNDDTYQFLAESLKVRED